MARSTFGGTHQDQVYKKVGGFLTLSSAKLTAWSAETGGTQYTDLLLNGSPVTQIIVPASGQIPAFQGPDDDGVEANRVRAMWIDDGDGQRHLIYDRAQGPAGPQGPGSSNSDVAGYVTAPGATKTALDGAYAPKALVDTGRLSEAVLDDTYAPVEVTRPAVTLSKLPDWAEGQWNYNGIPTIQDNIVTVGTSQYAAWWNGAGKPIIAKRLLPAGAWTSFDLSTIAGNPLASPVPADGHNTLSIGVDSTGRIHVSGNHHNNALRYVRSTNPGDITAWTAPGMVGTLESSVTYPAFVTLPDGTLLFFYRDGISGNGDLVANRYNTGTSTWTRLGVVIDGTPSNESPYWNRLAVDDNGDVHLFWCWRGTDTADTNNDFCYAKLTNLTTTMTAVKSTGAAQTLPITHANAEIVIDTAASGSGMINNHGADVDTLGRPHASTWLKDGGGKTQIQHVWHDGTAWRVDQATSLSRAINLAVSTFNPDLSRTQVICGPRGTTYIIYRCNYDGRKGTVRLIDVTTGPARSEFPIARLDLEQWEPSIDSRAARDRGELNMLLIALTANGAANSGLTSDSWNAQFAGVLSVDLNQVHLIAAGAAHIPQLRAVGDRGGPATGATITSTTLADFQHGPIAVPFTAGKQYFGRLQSRIRGGDSSSSVTVVFRENRDSPAATRDCATQTTTGLTNVHKISPWIPLQLFNADTDLGWVVAFASKSGAANGVVAVARVELAVIEYD